LATFLDSPKRQDAPDISKTLSEFMDYNSGLNNYGQRLTAFIQVGWSNISNFTAML
jgi:hypothetical protein